MREVTYAIAGFGGRGSKFSGLAKKPEMFARVVAVADPDAERRLAATSAWQLPPDMVFESAEALLAKPKLADAIINTTMDKLHASTSIPAMKRGYHVLLEKPMAVTLDDCLEIERTQRETGVMVGVCHSLRYTNFYAAIKRILDSGALGDVVSLDQVEGVNVVHFATSFVRGNWGNESRSCFMLMAKSCHDIDIMGYLIGKKCRRVSSFGSLTYFTRDNMPDGAPERCLDGCPAEPECPYHVGKIYLEQEFWRYPFVPNTDEKSVIEALRTGPHGKCVFQSDNDVVDHQVVSLEYDGGITATFTMTAFHPGGRLIHIFGTRGYLEGRIEENSIIHRDFLSGDRTAVDVGAPVGRGDHYGGDYCVLKTFTDAVRCGNPPGILATAQESLESQKVVFAAEKSRLEKRVVEVGEWK